MIRLPYTLAITHALIVNVGDETFALPLPTVEGITRVSREKILKHLTEDEPKLDYGGVTYRIQHLGSLVGAAPSALPEEENAVSLVLVRAGECFDGAAHRFTRRQPRNRRKDVRARTSRVWLA